MQIKHELVIYLNYYDASYKCQSQKSSYKCYFHFVISLLYPICNYNLLCNPLKYILIITHPVSVDKI